MIKLDKHIISWVYTILIWILFAGMMWSRAVLSIGVIVLPAFTILLHFKKVKAYLIQISWVWAMVLMFLIAALSLLWSTNLSNGGDSLMNKAMLFLVPLGMLGMPLKDAKWRMKTLIGVAFIHMVVMLTVGVIFLKDPAHWIAQYNAMGTMPVASYNDHIRFTLSLILLNVVFLHTAFGRRLFYVRQWKIIALIFAGISVLFIHLLASKSGIVLLYLALISWIALFLPNWKMKVGMSLGVLLLVFAMFKASPTFRKKVDMVKYQWDLFKNDGKLDYNNSDHGRIISYKVALKTMKENPVLGVGLGAELTEMKPNYKDMFPEIPEDKYIVPHNQYLYSSLSFGWFLAFIYCALLAIPIFFKRLQENKIELLALFVIFASMIPEATLEAQFGLFIVAFYLSWLRLIKPKYLHFE